MTLNIDKINYTTIHPQLNNKNNNQTQVTTTQKIASVLGCSTGIISTLALVAKKKNPDIFEHLKQPEDLIKTLKNLELNGKDVITIATGAITGGFAGGSITDKKNTKAKAKEGIVQLLGNYIIPTLFVGAGIKFNKALNKKFAYPPVNKLIQFAFGMSSLIVGVIVGNSISKDINQRIFHENCNRKLNWKNWILQFDNVCLVTSVSNEGTKLAQIVSKAIPVSHIIPGYLTGIKKDNK